MRRAGGLLLAAVALWLLPRAEAAGEATARGCTCYNDCERTLDSLTQPWCDTTPVSPPAGYPTCGKYSPSRDVWWDECTVNVTSSGQQVYLTTFDQIWTTITVSATATCASAYLVAGCAASLLTSPKRTIAWLPVTSALLGGCHGFLVGAMFGVVAAFMYLALPYAIDWAVAILLGVGLALLVTYSALGRSFRPFATPHAAEFCEPDARLG